MATDSSSGFSKAALVLIILIPLVVLGALWLYSAQIQMSSTSAPTAAQKQTPTPPVEQSPQTQADASIITLRDINGGSATAEGSRKFKDGVYNIGVRAEKLPSPSAGESYRVWLIRNAGYDNALTLNALHLAQNAPNKGSYVLGAQIKEDARVYSGMIITLQPMSDQKPNNVILEGAFK